MRERYMLRAHKDFPTHLSLNRNTEDCLKGQTCL